MLRYPITISLAVLAVAAAVMLGRRALGWNNELAVTSPLARVAPVLDDPRTPRLARRVVLVVIDGLRADEADLPWLDELADRGSRTIARAPYPTVSRPNYVTILTGVPPRDSGVRANRVDAPVVVDTLMDRVRAAGLAGAAASAVGRLAARWRRATAARAGGAGRSSGGRFAPPPPLTWPFDDARRVDSLDSLGPILAELVASDAALVPVLVLDVDRAGHRSGVGAAYRAAAAAVDAMLRTALARVDLTHDAVIVTADHGHVAPGGHGGIEREVTHVPLVLAGAGVVPGATAVDAQLVDVAPTAAALLGVAAPGHAEGRTLVELLALAPAAAARRSAVVQARGRRIAAAVATALADGVEPRPIALAFAIAAVAVAVALGVARALGRSGALAVSWRGGLASALAVPLLMLVTLAATRGQMSPSYVPSLSRLQTLGALAVAATIALQVFVSWRVVRGARDRIAAASGGALVGLALALGVTGTARAWFSPPHVDLPPPLWMVVVPALDLAAAACSVAAALVIALALVLASPRSSVD